jgi:uncharacterized protein (TIGR03435 family)
VETPNADPPPASPPAKIGNDANGFPVLPPGRPGFSSNFGPGQLAHWTARQQTMATLARQLSYPIVGTGRQVIDKTGLTGKYDFTLVYAMRVPGVSATDDTPGLFIEYALEEELGLKLVEAKAAFDFVIIDRGEKVPTEN